MLVMFFFGGGGAVWMSWNKLSCFILFLLRLSKCITRDKREPFLLSCVFHINTNTPKDHHFFSIIISSNKKGIMKCTCFVVKQVKKFCWFLPYYVCCPAGIRIQYQSKLSIFSSTFIKCWWRWWWWWCAVMKQPNRLHKNELSAS